MIQYGSGMKDMLGQIIRSLGGIRVGRPAFGSFAYIKLAILHRSTCYQLQGLVCCKLCLAKLFTQKPAFCKCPEFRPSIMSAHSLCPWNKFENIDMESGTCWRYGMPWNMSWSYCSALKCEYVPPWSTCWSRDCCDLADWGTDFS